MTFPSIPNTQTAKFYSTKNINAHYILTTFQNDNGLIKLLSGLVSYPVKAKYY